MAIKLPNPFKEFLELLNQNKVEYLLIGGYAVTYYGYARATNDIDIWIAINKKNATKLLKVLTDFGLKGLSVDFLLKSTHLRIGSTPHND